MWNSKWKYWNSLCHAFLQAGGRARASASHVCIRLHYCVCVCACAFPLSHNVVTQRCHPQVNPALGQGTRHCATQNRPSEKFDIWVATPALTPTLTPLPQSLPTHKTLNSTRNNALLLKPKRRERSCSPTHTFPVALSHTPTLLCTRARHCLLPIEVPLPNPPPPPPPQHAPINNAILSLFFSLLR